MSFFPRGDAWQPLTVLCNFPSSVFDLSSHPHPLQGTGLVISGVTLSLSFPEVSGSCLKQPESKERGRPPATGQPPEGGLNKQALARERGNSQSLPLSHCHCPTFTGQAGRPRGRGGSEHVEPGAVPAPLHKSHTLSTLQGKHFHSHFREQETEVQSGGGSQPMPLGDELLDSS